MAPYLLTMNSEEVGSPGTSPKEPEDNKTAMPVASSTPEAASGWKRQALPFSVEALISDRKPNKVVSTDSISTGTAQASFPTRMLKPENGTSSPVRDFPHLEERCKPESESLGEKGSNPWYQSSSYSSPTSKCNHPLGS